VVGAFAGSPPSEKMPSSNDSCPRPDVLLVAFLCSGARRVDAAQINSLRIRRVGVGGRSTLSPAVTHERPRWVQRIGLEMAASPYPRAVALRRHSRSRASSGVCCYHVTHKGMI